MSVSLRLCSVTDIKTVRMELTSVAAVSVCIITPTVVVNFRAEADKEASENVLGDWEIMTARNK